MQQKLRPGTIVAVDTTLVCWHIAPKGSFKARKVSLNSLNKFKKKYINKHSHKVYQIQGHRVEILHESNGPVEELRILSLPKKDTAKNITIDSSPRKSASSVLNAIGSEFGIHK